MYIFDSGTSGHIPLPFMKAQGHTYLHGKHLQWTLKWLQKMQVALWKVLTASQGFAMSSKWCNFPDVSIVIIFIHFPEMFKQIISGLIPCTPSGSSRLFQLLLSHAQ